GDDLVDVPIGVADRALERTVTLDARAIGGRADAVVARERIAEAHVLARHVTAHAARAGAGRIVMRVRAQRCGGGVFLVAFGADRIAGGRGQRGESLARVFAMRVVADRAGHLLRAAAEQKIAPLAGVDRAAARIALAAPAFPGERIAREQH